MCKKQEYLQLYKISTSVENEDPPQNHLETAGNCFQRLLDTEGV